MTEMKRPALPLTGGCPCGTIRFEVTAMPLFVYACHCTDCQRWSGSAFSMSMPVASKSFSVLRGQPKPWRRINSMGVRVSYWFCSDCGGRIYGERESRPDIIVVRAGTLDDRSWLAPIAHVFMRSAQPWEQVSGDAECFETMPKDFQSLAEKWSQRWQA